MIQVTADRSADKRITSFTMEGHAGSGPYGFDLVCAGASAVSFGAVNAVYELTQTALDVEMSEDGGYLHVRVPDLSGPQAANVQLLLEGMLVSLQTIEEQYHEFISVKTSFDGR
ncbi:ribosomal-processing cysteine protease Prp [Alkalicoccus urumqiensis]|uniref:Ribosomal processing cysteine protease Prp n=1 Tax=Alkalicoccus urumqiensis TaxID=1548213 RepID=A0A2P6MF36_ALKUR|nr:ribosomal-processing cysteine protease Prp [Alkalicoccus urumqiensis]PRO64884.1 ribosomal-processing cysteine protease Prp [Alkalicoccus urumqiensis]